MNDGNDVAPDLDGVHHRLDRVRVERLVSRARRTSEPRMNWRGLTIALFIAAGAVYWLWPQIKLVWDAASNKFNF